MHIYTTNIFISRVLDQINRYLSLKLMAFCLCYHIWKIRKRFVLLILAVPWIFLIINFLTFQFNFIALNVSDKIYKKISNYYTNLAVLIHMSFR